MLLDKRYSQQGIIEDFRYAYQEWQTWFEKISKSLTEIDENQNMNSEERLQKLQEIVDDFEISLQILKKSLRLFYKKLEIWISSKLMSRLNLCREGWLI